ncbi:MAG: hypothetical protein RBT71_11730, partial [Flavobacteriales bacterium]|nr:hypothetical protein [Flavobacteriales bacterium]
MMRNIVLVLLLAVLAALEAKAQVAAAEYFFDADPGVGNGTAAALIPGPGNTATIAIDVDASTLSAGFHFLSVRFQDADGRWGIAESRPVYIHGTTAIGPAAPLVAAEYFFDDDPGVGNGTAAALVPGPGNTAAIAIDVDASTLPAGFHFLCVRFQDADGRWGIA